MAEKKYTIGIDFGTDSVRTIIADTSDGSILGTAVHRYGRWAAGRYCDPQKNQFRQHPLDYLEGMEQTVKESLAGLPSGVVEQIAAISVDTTGSTPVAVNRRGVPLALIEGFEENPNAMFLLWKDHTAVGEAEEINELSGTWGGVDFTKYEGGIYSSEWFWAKILHVLRNDPEVRRAAYSWVEHCDWIPFLLTGQTDPLTMKRSRCAAGHKAMWHPDWGGLPAEEFLTELDPLLGGIRERLYEDTYTSQTKAGIISADWAQKLGLPADVAVGVGVIDAHIGAVGAEIKPYYLTKVMGTSTCDMMVVPREELEDNLVSGICGQVDGSIMPGMVGLEAGQSAFGDVYAWFRDVLRWPAEQVLAKTELIDAPTREKLLAEITEQIIPELAEAAAAIPVDESGLVALDWLNGRRTPDANQNLKGGIVGLTLGTDAPQIFKALVEATAFGSKKIIDRFRKEGVRIDGVIALGGVANRSEFVMQIVADVLGVPIVVARSEQTCALGAAMAASVVGDIYHSFEEAQKAMGSGFEKEYQPNPENTEKYKLLYERYSELGEYVEQQTVLRGRNETIIK